MVTDIDIFLNILAVSMFSGLIYVICEIEKCGLKLEQLDKPIVDGKNKLDVAFREFARQVVRGLLITLRAVERK